MNLKVKKGLSIIILLCGYLSLYAQKPTASQTLTKIESYYKSLSEFNFEVEYKMYKGYEGNHITESYKGTMYKNGDVSQIKILGSEIIQFSDTQLTITNDNKTLIYNKISEDVIHKSPMDVSSFLKFYKETNTEIKGNVLIHEMVIKNAQIPMPYNKIKVYVNKETSEIERQVLYLATKVPFVDENGKEAPDVGRMEISFKKNPKSVSKVPELNDYVILDSQNNVRLAKAFTAYTIINQTNL
ncbi:MAG: hypothetical protein ABJK28_17270 [Algibacter sp.]